MSEIVEMDFIQQNPLEMTLNTKDTLDLEFDSSSGTNNYNSLSNKPQINGVTLVGNKTSKDIKVQDEMDVLSVQEIEKILYLN